MEVGQVCVKIAGRDAGQHCVVVDVLDGNFVLVDGNTRRRKCNIKHLEPLMEMVNIEKNATHEDVIKALKETNVKITESKKSSKVKKTKTSKPVPKRKALLKEHPKEEKK